MSRHGVYFTLVEMYAIKHALQKQVKEKNERLEDISTNTECGDWDGELEEEFNKLNKDVVHERALIARMDREIKEYKECKRIK